MTETKPHTYQATVNLSAEDLANVFCELTDDAQAQFFVHVAKLMSEWDGTAAVQLAYIGRHLSECACATADARNWILDLAWHIEAGEGNKKE